MQSVVEGAKIQSKLIHTPQSPNREAGLLKNALNPTTVPTVG